jgi:hypothetical protein
MRAIVLLGGEISLVNDEKYDELVIYSWHLHSNGYAVRCNGGHSTYMHRVVINAPDKVWVDHIDGDKLDNRIENLRLCNASQNGGNRGPICNNELGYKGVRKHRKNYQARVIFHGKETTIGTFTTPEEAARAYDNKVMELFGEFAKTNFIKETE